MVADHVIIRHDRLLPQTGWHMGFMPLDFAGFGSISWIEKHRDQLPSAGTLPHMQSAPPLETLRPFIDWLCADGRQWFESGMVTYTPFLVPGEVEAGLLNDGVNLSKEYESARILPQESRLLDSAAARALADLNIPYLDSISAELLSHFRQDEADVVAGFRTHFVKLLAQVSAEVASPQFSQDIEKLSIELEDETKRLEASIEKHAKTQTWRRLRPELLTLSALVFFWLGVPAAGVTGLTAAALELANSLKDDLQDRFSLRQNPVYFLARLGHLIRKQDRWSQRIRRVDETV